MIEVGSSRLQNPNLAYALRIFGRPPRTTACDCERAMEPALPQSLFRMTDRGKNDYKVFGVPHSDPLFAELQALTDVAHHFLREVEHFFATYKQLEGEKVETLGWAPAAEAIAEVKASVERYKK